MSYSAKNIAIENSDQTVTIHCYHKCEFEINQSRYSHEPDTTRVSDIICAYTPNFINRLSEPDMKIDIIVGPVISQELSFRTINRSSMISHTYVYFSIF